jgi:hypothetical protein
LNDEELQELKIQLFDEIYSTWETERNFVNLLTVKKSMTTYENMKKFSGGQQ